MIWGTKSFGGAKQAGVSVLNGCLGYVSAIQLEAVRWSENRSGPLIIHSWVKLNLATKMGSGLPKV